MGNDQRLVVGMELANSETVHKTPVKLAAPSDHETWAAAIYLYAVFHALNPFGPESLLCGNVRIARDTPLMCLACTDATGQK